MEATLSSVRFCALDQAPILQCRTLMEKTKTSVRLEPDTAAFLKGMAKVNNTTITAIVELCVKSYFPIYTEDENYEIEI